MTATEVLAKEIVSTKFKDLPSKVVERIKTAIMDDVGNAFMAFQAIDKPLVQFAKAIGGVPESTIIGDGAKVSCGLAAGINAEMAANSGLNETGPGMHALSSIAQTGIAVGERVEASGKDLILAVALAYELNGRFDRNLRDKTPIIHIYPAQVRRHLHLNTAVCAAKILCLDEKQVNEVIGTAWMLSPPSIELILKKCHWIRNHSIWACQFGVQAALLIQNGSEGPYDILDKDCGDIYDLENLYKSPSPFYYVSEELCLKPWLGSYGFLGGIELLKNIVKQYKLGPNDIEEIIFHGSSLYTESPFNDPTPGDYFAASNSVPWCFAIVVLGYSSALDWISEERLTDQVAHNISRKVRTVTAESPLVNKVEVTTKDNRYEDQISREDTLGTPKRPMSKEMIDQKFIGLTSRLIGKKQANKLIKVFDKLEDLENIKELTTLF